MDPLCLRLILTCIFFFLRHSFNSWIRLRIWRWYELNEILRIASKAMNNFIPHNYLLQTYVTWIFKTNNRSNCSYLRILGNKSNFSKCQTSERNRNRCFEQDQSETPSESLSKKGSQLIVRPLALYQPAFCKRRSSCITDERNIGADFDRNVYPWSLLSIRAQQLVNRLSLSASRHRRRESPSSWGAIRPPRIYRAAASSRGTICFSRIRREIWYFCPANVARVVRPNEARKSSRHELGRRWISRWCKWLELMRWSEGRGGFECVLCNVSTIGKKDLQGGCFM